MGRGRPSGPNTIGPRPQSNWSHRPGSVIQGRYCRRCPLRQPCLTIATARRVVRSSPVNPIATSRSCTTSARTPPSEVSTNSSIFGRNGSISLGRAAGWSNRLPGVSLGDVASHRLGVHPRQRRRRVGAASGVERFQNLHDLPVRLLHSPSGQAARAWLETSSVAPEGPLISDRHDRPRYPWKGRSAVRGEGDEVSAYRDLGLSAVTDSGDCRGGNRYLAMLEMSSHRGPAPQDMSAVRRRRYVGHPNVFARRGASSTHVPGAAVGCASSTSGTQ